jgi:predicted Fe-Mo cluster-binding NifX family protein
MKIAIPIWQGRVSPVFDAAGSLLVADIENGQEVRHIEKSLALKNPLSRVNFITQLGVEVLICGAISLQLHNALTSSGVKVISFTCGPVEDVIRAFMNHRLSDNAFLMPGCSSQRRSSAPMGSRIAKNDNHKSTFILIQ